MVELKIKCVSELYDQETLIPEYKTEGSAGMDLKAAISEPMVLEPGERYLVPSGIAIALPECTVGLVYPRSGLAAKKGIGLANSVGVIDEDYRGEVFCPLINLSKVPYTLNPLERMAQLVITPILKPKVVTVDDLEETERGSGGFGSTGKH